MAKIAIVLMAGSEMPCRLMHGLIWAMDVVKQGGEAQIVFEGASPSWLLDLPMDTHPQHKLYVKAKEMGLIAGVCQACAMQAEALEAAQAEGLTLLKAAGGHASLVPFVAQGFQVMML